MNDGLSEEYAIFVNSGKQFVRVDNNSDGNLVLFLFLYAIIWFVLGCIIGSKFFKKEKQENKQEETDPADWWKTGNPPSY